MTGKIARAEIDINAPPERVWNALVDPALVSQYFFGATVESDFQPGSRIVWRGEWNGKPFEDHGEILEVVPNELLRLTHFSPLAGKPDEPGNYHTLTYTLEQRDAATLLVLEQDNNATAEEAEHSAANWRTMLAGIRRTVEETDS